MYVTVRRGAQGIELVDNGGDGVIGLADLLGMLGLAGLERFVRGGMAIELVFELIDLLPKTVRGCSAVFLNAPLIRCDFIDAVLDG